MEQKRKKPARKEKPATDWQKMLRQSLEAAEESLGRE